MTPPASLPSVDADDPARLLARGQQALRSGDLALARQTFERLAELDRQTPQPWIHLAMVYRALRDAQSEEQALFRALSIDAHDLMALLMRGKLMERLGRRHEAAAAYQGAVAVAPPLERLVPELRPLLAQASAFSERYRQGHGDFIERFIAAHGGGLEAEALERFRLSLDLQFGRKKRYESQPMGYFVPGLQPVEFFERGQFPWLDAIEAATDAIRAEFLAVWKGEQGGQADQAEQGFAPYINYGHDQPLNQWLELNQSPRWSAFHLLKDGLPVPGNAERCPLTLQALAGAPQPEQPGRTPVAMFSLLKPRTRIPPHVGISNARLVCHLPLIVPEGCGFRVGNQTRHWQPGQAWVFDDTIEHEAWNDSGQLRVVLIFDIWHPALSAEERRMIGLMSAAEAEFMGRAGGFEL